MTCAADLNPDARNDKLHFVFLNTKNGLPHANDFAVRDRFIKAHLLAAAVRYRGPGQCRHTYASQLLTTGGRRSTGSPNRWATLTGT